MILDSEAIESIMAWARQQVPLESKRQFHINGGFLRRVRVEINAEPETNCHSVTPDLRRDVIMCRVYLAEPRCIHPGKCECGPHAETRLIPTLHFCVVPVAPPP